MCLERSVVAGVSDRNRAASLFSRMFKDCVKPKPNSDSNSNSHTASLAGLHVATYSTWQVEVITIACCFDFQHTAPSFRMNKYPDTDRNVCESLAKSASTYHRRTFSAWKILFHLARHGLCVLRKVEIIPLCSAEIPKLPCAHDQTEIA